MSRWKHSQLFSNFGDGDSENSDDDYMDAKHNSGWHSKYSSDFQSQASSLRSRRTRKAAQSLQEDLFDQLDDEPLDLLDQKKTKFALRSSELIKQKSDSSDQPEIDSEGRLIIHEEGREKKGGRTRKREMPIDTEVGEVRSHLFENSQKVQKRRKTSKSGWAYTGSEYASKKAGGDVNRKDKLEPYAYWPLDRKMMSRRQEHRAAARKGMASIVKLTKKLEGGSVSKALLMKRVTLKNGTRKGNQKKSEATISLEGEKWIREQSQSCLCEVLLNFQISPVLVALLANASEAVANVFERFRFLDGGSNAKASEIHK
ncbi:ARM repeat superfamily protein [Forsythia ovata]|uniref:ARM repeat superfamily protein n=1 Tax=Forsythia ovata TaxID=205694 RepID=A0ABD1RGL2_9LAMI